MNLAQSAIPPQLGNLRKREFLEYAEANLYEADRQGKWHESWKL